jgi:hypothetical protein
MTSTGEHYIASTGEFWSVLVSNGEHWLVLVSTSEYGEYCRALRIERTGREKGVSQPSARGAREEKEPIERTGRGRVLGSTGEYWGIQGNTEGYQASCGEHW